MQTLQPVLLCGRYEWRRDLQPVAEFEARLEAVRRAMRANGWDALIVHGDSRENAALCYLTNVVPNQRWSLALIAPDRPPQLVASVGSRDLPAVQRLTWVEDVRASGEVPTPLSQWLTAIAGKERGTGRALKIGVVDLARMRANIGRDVVEVCGGFGEIVDATPALAAGRRSKSPNELKLLRKSYRILQDAIAEIEKRRQAGSPLAAALIAAERMARVADAQDVRSLCNAGGHGALYPVGRAAQLDSRGPWGVYLAVRFCGYWTEAFATLASSPMPVFAAARRAVDAAAEKMHAGASGRQFADAMKPQIAGFGQHPMLGSKIARAHGLSLDAQPWITRDCAEQVPGDGAYMVVAGAVDGDGRHVLESATVILDGAQRTVLHPCRSDPGVVDVRFGVARMSNKGVAL
jgi:Xaa-Pro aminopeptidase